MATPAARQRSRRDEEGQAEQRTATDGHEELEEEKET